jgi:hypothetical protein
VASDAGTAPPNRRDMTGDQAVELLETVGIEPPKYDTDADIPPKEREFLKHFGALYADDDTESGQMVDAKGKKFPPITSGAETYVNLPVDYQENLRDGVFVHNHPSGTSLSRGDLDVAMTNNARAIVAIGRSPFDNAVTMYRLSRTEAHWGIAALTKAYERHDADAHALYEPLVKSGHLNQWAAWDAHKDYVWRQMAADGLVQYERIKLSEGTKKADKPKPRYVPDDEPGVIPLDKDDINPYENIPVKKGGPGSGHRGHAGRPGERGGSAPGTAGTGATAGGAVAEREQFTPFTGTRPTGHVPAEKLPALVPTDIYIGVRDGTIDYEDAVAELTKRAGAHVFVERVGPTSMADHVAMLAAVVDAPIWAQDALKGPGAFKLMLTGETGDPIKVGDKVFGRGGEANHDTRQIRVWSGMPGVYRVTAHELAHAGLSHAFEAERFNAGERRRLQNNTNDFTDASTLEGGVTPYAEAYRTAPQGAFSVGSGPVGVYTHENFAEIVGRMVSNPNHTPELLQASHPKTWLAFKNLERALNARITTRLDRTEAFNKVLPMPHTT